MSKQSALDAMLQAIGALSKYEQVFILSMCQFYCDSDTRALCAETGIPMPSLDKIARMDDTHLDPVDGELHRVVVHHNKKRLTIEMTRLAGDL